ncbi:TlpA family protein disulfide reductase [Clostridium swellfunianum]|uniref:TlpA disulfide reductase family protein n=1 Tax=Clostridium swellfunianum TaxID=1367462 RepID=UPI00202E738C|nr:redoxin domain-containing protein [Clostridium swellfunianum]MCM0648373.1 TlpA family protein disulfide reductase [Clostridium swellfunianum]
MKKKILTVSLALLVLGAVYTVQNYTKNIGDDRQNTSTSTADSKTASQSPAVSQLKPEAVKIKSVDFTLPDLDGKAVALSDFKGKKVMLNFFATWCRPCLEEMPDMEKLYQETKNSDLVILAVNLGEDAETVKDFMKKNNYNFPVLLDLKGTAADKYSVSAIPTTYFLDKDGNIIPFEDLIIKRNVTRKQGAMSLDEMKTYIKSLDNK